MNIQTQTDRVEKMMNHLDMAHTMACEGKPLSCAHNIILALCALVRDDDLVLVEYTLGVCEERLGHSLMAFLDEATAGGRHG